MRIIKWSRTITLAICALSPLLTVKSVAAESISLEQLAEHSSASSCWIAVEGVVYDITSSLKDHQKQYKYDLSSHCGKDSSSAWKDKAGKGKAHSRKAQLQIKKLLIGVLK